MKPHTLVLAAVVGFLLAAAESSAEAGQASKEGRSSGAGGSSSKSARSPPIDADNNNISGSRKGGKGASFLGSQPRTWLFVADPGTFSGTPENAIYVANLAGQNASFPPGATSCPDARYGTIMGLPVAIITTGIGPLAAALCTFDILNSFAPLVKEIIFSGTSGWSPQVGGILNPDACDSANNAGRPNYIGDVCVSPFSVNWDCRKASWTMTAKNYIAVGGGGQANQCSEPEQGGDASSTALFGRCMFADSTPSQLALADEILAAATAPGARSSEMPPRPTEVVANEEKYWTTMSQGTGVTYEPPLDPQALPHVYSYTECVEIDSQYFWSGSPWDYIARKYVASTLRKAGVGGKATTTTATTTTKPDSVIAVSAMEAIGVAQALARYHETSKSKVRTPFTFVRGMSDRTMQPVARASPGSSEWVDGPRVAADFVNGYRYAIQSSASVVLSLLQARCRAASVSAGAGGRSSSSAAAKTCSYTIG